MRRTLTSLLIALVVVACGRPGVTASQPSTTTITSVAAASTTTSAPSVETTIFIPVPEPVEVAEQRSITVGGIGSAYATPTRAVVDLAVTTRGSGVAGTANEASSAASAMQAALISSGVDARDIQTSEFSIGPYYWDYPEIAGYEMTLGYRVTLSDVERLGEILGAAVQAGGDDVRAHGLRFEADPDGLMEAARSDAWTDVEARARALAELSGEALGPVVDIHEKVLLSNASGMVQGGEGDSATFDIPASPGVAGVVVLLTVSYSIGE